MPARKRGPEPMHTEKEVVMDSGYPRLRAGVGRNDEVGVLQCERNPL